MYRCLHCRTVVELRNPAEAIEAVAARLPGCDELRQQTDATRVGSGKASDECFRLGRIGADKVLASHVKDGEDLPVGVAVPDTKEITFGTSTLARSGNNLIATLPTSDPVEAGALWVDSGTVKVSAGS